LPVPCDYVIAQRTFRRPDESIMQIGEEKLHVDTNCFFLLPGAFCAIPHWAMMPSRMATGGDRVFLSALASREFVAARASKPTVNYLTLYEAHYRALGEAPPPGAKPNVRSGALMAWLQSLPPRESEIAGRLMGFVTPRDDQPSPRTVPPTRAKVARNEKCPCGSGRKYKHCHGASTR
jgi:hypothetical protein